MVGDTTSAPRRWVSRLKLIGAFVLVAAVSSCAIAVWAGLIGIAGKSLPPLAEAAYEPTWQAFSSKFDQELHAKFPIGSDESALMRTLWEQGFRPGLGSGKYQNEASFYPGGFCSAQTSVSWSADGDGHLTEIDGWVDAACL